MITIERAAFDSFHAQWNQGKFWGQRLGQAFFNYFDLHKMRPTPFTDRIWNLDAGPALNEIKKNVIFS